MLGRKRREEWLKNQRTKNRQFEENYKAEHGGVEEKPKLEKNDKAAMLLAALYTIFLPCILVLAFLCVIVIALFGGFG